MVRRSDGRATVSNGRREAASRMPYRRRWQPCARNGVLFMAVTEQEFDQDEKRMTELRAAGHAVSARYDRRRARVVVALNLGVELTFPARDRKGLVTGNGL